MAKLNRQVIGKLSGKIGDIVFRQRNGKTFAASRPASFFPGFDAASIGRRNRFGIACKFSSKVYAHPYLKKIWKKHLLSSASPYNHITKINYKYAVAGELTDFAIIVPDLGFNITVGSSISFPHSMQVTINNIGSNSGIDPAREPVLRICTIMCLTNPKDGSVNHVEFISMVSEEQNAVFDEPLNFWLYYPKKEIQLFNNYQDKKAFLTLISFDTDNNPVHYSKTFLLYDT